MVPKSLKSTPFFDTFGFIAAAFFPFVFAVVLAFAFDPAATAAFFLALGTDFAAGFDFAAAFLAGEAPCPAFPCGFAAFFFGAATRAVFLDATLLLEVDPFFSVDSSKSFLAMRPPCEN
jgi:hypothetical protein